MRQIRFHKCYDAWIFACNGKYSNTIDVGSRGFPLVGQCDRVRFLSSTLPTANCLTYPMEGSYNARIKLVIDSRVLSDGDSAPAL